jgi:hypothetical protein
MTEQQEYLVVSSRGGVELRDYAPCVVADVSVAGSADQAASTAFRPLFNYISGANRTSSPIAMTAPVLQQSASERLAMTAPVIQEPAGSAQWTVSFVLPGSRALSEYPVPTDSRVTLRALPAERAAALRWSGRWTSGNVSRRTAELRQVIAEEGWTISGEARWARFDPPWKPPFARRNEIVIPVLAAA